jgi:hypothetical protein
MTESLPTVTSNHREYKVISSIDNDNSSHGFISNDDADNNQDTTSDNNDLDDKILAMIRNHRYKCSSSYSTDDETVDMEINDENNENDIIDYDDYENNKKNYKNQNFKNESTYDDGDDDSMDYGMIEMRIINNKIEYVKVDDHSHKGSYISSRSNSRSSSSSNSDAGGVINNKTVLRDPKVLLATANYGNISRCYAFSPFLSS